MVWCHVIGMTLSKTTLCAHRFYFHSLTASDGLEGTTARRVASPRPIMWCCHVIGMTLLKTTLCAHRFYFLHSFWWFRGNHRTPWGITSPYHVVLSRHRHDIVKDHTLCSSLLLPSQLLMVQREPPHAVRHHLALSCGVVTWSAWHC